MKNDHEHCFHVLRKAHLVAPPAVLALLVLGGCDYSDKAAKEARAYANELGIQLTGVSCVRTDSDGDGYVSCSLAKADGSLLAVECAIGMPFTWNSGCRVPKAVIPGGR